MKLNFSVDYITSWGEVVFVASSLPQLQSAQMDYQPDRGWSLSVDVSSNISDFTYSYFVKNSSGHIVREWGRPRNFVKRDSIDAYYFQDQWMGIPYNSPFFSSAFTNAFFARKNRRPTVSCHASSPLTLRVFAPDVPAGKSVALLGNTPLLGNWDERNLLILDDAQFPLWSITIDRELLTIPLEYKFALVDTHSRMPEQWENGGNRLLTHFPPRGEALIVTCGVFRGNAPAWRCAGVAIPVFSLRSDTSFGIGDFADLKMMIDWVANTGQRVVQLLPVNDTTMTRTWTDSYPYNAITIFALHPLYLNLSAFGTLKDKTTVASACKKQRELNALPDVDYEAVAAAKWRIYRAAYNELGKQTLDSEAYREFMSKNCGWLKPYAVFCYLRDKFHTVDFSQWGEYATYEPTRIPDFFDRSSAVFDDVAIHCFLQYHLHLQLKAASDYARANGVILKGDIPIGISPDSVEAWTEPSLFNMDSQTGAPPDDFSLTGQNWGFPTYNWDRMKQDGFDWWRRRFTTMADYFDAYRIDHLLGFFRIWEIPLDAVQGLLGHFSPALPLSVEEIQAYGFQVDTERHLRPFIRDYQLKEIFGTATENVVETFLTNEGNGVFSLKRAYDTQRKIASYFAQGNDDIAVRDGLYALVAEVLFVRDPRQPEKLHPRITAQHTYSYKALPESDRFIFDRIYNHFYYERHNDFWSEQAMQKLPDLITATDMLPCAEDLGMIPACVPHVMKVLHLLSLEIERMPKEPMRKFANTEQYPYLSVATTSTHDMSTLRAWWEEDAGSRQIYFNEVLGQAGEAPLHAEAGLCSDIISKHLESPAMLAIFPLQDWLSMDEDLRRPNPLDERINVPSNPRHYWRYRMHVTLEKLLAASDLNEKIRGLVKDSGRC